MRHLALAFLACPFAVQAADFTVSGGYGARGGPAISASVDTSDRGADGYFSFGVIAAGEYKLRGRDVEPNGGPYVQAVWGDRFRVGLGGVYLLNKSRIHGSNANFMLSAGYYRKGWQLYWAHISNANFARPNWGYDMIALGIRF